MSTTVADLRAKISVDGADKAKSDLKGVGDSADKAKSHLGGLGSSVGTLKDAFVGGLGAIGGVITGFLGVEIVGKTIDFVKDQLVDLYQEAASQQQVMAQTAAVIKSTGGVAGVTADQVGDLADALARQTGVADDTIQSGENILLTFKSIGKDIFPQTTQAVLDMSVALHENMQDAAIQVGKALQDPILGVTALRRVGVQLSDSQIALVKHLMDTGQQAKAQAVILKELTSEFGGSAKAAGQTFPGELKRLGVSFDQMKEKIGLAVFPVLQSLMDKYLLPAANWFGEQLPAAITILTTFLTNDLEPAINAVVNSPVVTTIEGWAQSFAKTLTQAANTGTQALNEHGVAGGADKAKASLKGLDGQAKSTATTIDSKDGLVGHVNAGIESILGLAGAIDAPDTPAKPHLTPAMQRYESKLKQLDDAQTQHDKKVQSQSIPVISGLGDLFGRAGEKVGEFVDGIKKRFPAAEDQIQRIGNFLGGVFGPDGALPGLQTMWDGFWGALSFPVRIAFDFVTGLVNAGLDLLGGNFTQFEQDTSKTFQTLLGDIEDFGASIGRFLIGPFEAGLGGIIGAVQHFPDLFAPEFTKAWQSLGVSTGRAIIAWGESALQQLEIWANKVIDAYNNTIGSLPGFSKLHEGEVIQLPSGGGRTPGVGKRATGGPTSGLFEGAEEGAELLVKHGIYYAPPGSYVYDAQQTRQILSGSGNRRGGGGDTYITVNGADATSAAQIASHVHRELRRRDLLSGMGVA